MFQVITTKQAEQFLGHIILLNHLYILSYLCWQSKIGYRQKIHCKITLNTATPSQEVYSAEGRQWNSSGGRQNRNSSTPSRGSSLLGGGKLLWNSLACFWRFFHRIIVSSFSTKTVTVNGLHLWLFQQEPSLFRLIFDDLLSVTAPQCLRQGRVNVEHRHTPLTPGWEVLRRALTWRGLQPQRRSVLPREAHPRPPPSNFSRRRWGSCTGRPGKRMATAIYMGRMGKSNPPMYLGGYFKRVSAGQLDLLG